MVQLKQQDWKLIQHVRVSAEYREIEEAISDYYALNRQVSSLYQ